MFAQSGSIAVKLHHPLFMSIVGSVETAELCPSFPSTGRQRALHLRSFISTALKKK